MLTRPSLFVAAASVCTVRQLTTIQLYINQLLNFTKCRRNHDESPNLVLISRRIWAAQSHDAGTSVSFAYVLSHHSWSAWQSTDMDRTGLTVAIAGFLPSRCDTKRAERKGPPPILFSKNGWPVSWIELEWKLKWKPDSNSTFLLKTMKPTIVNLDPWEFRDWGCYGPNTGNGNCSGWKMGQNCDIQCIFFHDRREWDVWKIVTGNAATPWLSMENQAWKTCHWWFQFLWKIWVRQLGGWHSINIWKNKSHVSNHQPDIHMQHT